MKLSSGLIITCLIAIIIIWAFYMISMPGKSYKGPLPSLNKEAQSIKNDLNQHVHHLAENIGERNMWRLTQLNDAADYIEQVWQAQGFNVKRHTYKIENKEYYNLYIDISGNDLRDELIIVGAHYDSVYGSPGANDNGTGIAAILALSKQFKNKKPKRSLRFVAFTNEEPPIYFSKYMGSMEYVNSILSEKEKIKAMISVETIGYYDDTPNSQKYPFFLKLFYPNRGNFIGFVSNMFSRKLLRRSLLVFRNKAQFPSEGIAAPSFIPGVAWSDQWAFWRQGIPAIMITDTALFRYPYYHAKEDTPDKIDYDRLTRAVLGIEYVIDDLLGK